MRRGDFPKREDRLQRALEFIKNYKRIHGGNSPSLREIAGGCGVRGASYALALVNELELRGKIRRCHNVTRSIEITELS